MTAELNYHRLHAVISEGEYALARLTASYEPAGGPGSLVFPPTFPVPDRSTEPPYLLQERRVGDLTRPVVVLDQVQSEANRAEEAVLNAWRSGSVSLPVMRIRHEGQAAVTLTSWELPHRYADAYLRDSLLDGVKFDSTDLGKSFQAATGADARALYRQDPSSLVFGAWNSHRKGRQAKFPRTYSSEIVGWDPIVGNRKAGRMDPVNLVGARSGEGDSWTYSASEAKAKNGRLSEIGHGNIAPNDSHGGVSISSATRFATLSLTGLNRIGFGDLPAPAGIAARTALAALGLMADRLAFAGPSVWLRSQCELVTESELLEWVGRGGVADPFTLSRDAAVSLFAESVEAAAAAGIGMNLDTVELTPSPALKAALDFSLTKAETPGE